MLMTVQPAEASVDDYGSSEDVECDSEYVPLFLDEMESPRLESWMDEHRSSLSLRQKDLLIVRRRAIQQARRNADPDFPRPSVEADV